MPELPEVETTRRGIAPYLEGKRVRKVVARIPRLRLPVPPELAAALPDRVIRKVLRRGKYLILMTDAGSAILHLGMSGSLRIVEADAPPGKHDHLDIVLDSGLALRLTDPRRFGLALWTAGDPLAHPLLAGLGPEPLEDGFDGAYLHRAGRKRTVAIKQFIMDGSVVAGIGNIYASEALFRAGIRPDLPAGQLTPSRCKRLAAAVREVLAEAVSRGAAALQVFRDGSGSVEWFTIRTDVYGRAGDPCPRCGAPIRSTRQGNRATYFCPRCQR